MIRGYIYKLVDPSNEQILYVGSTVRGLKERFDQHLQCINKETSQPIYVYLRNSGVVPKIELIESIRVVKIEKLREREYWWISALMGGGFSLYNQVGKPKMPRIIKRKPNYIKICQPIVQLLTYDMSILAAAKKLEMNSKAALRYMSLAKIEAECRTTAGLTMYYMRRKLVV